MFQNFKQSLENFGAGFYANCYSIGWTTNNRNFFFWWWWWGEGFGGFLHYLLATYDGKC